MMFMLMMTWLCHQLLQQQLLVLMIMIGHFVNGFDQCSSSCACLGNTVDCSNKQLPDIPTDLPSWTQIL